MCSHDQLGLFARASLDELKRDGDSVMSDGDECARDAHSSISDEEGGRQKARRSRARVWCVRM